MLSPGARIAGRFEVLAEAARGGMGTVYRARDRATRDTVALKVLDRSEVSDTARFAREAALLGELSHPAIVRYVTHGETSDGLAYLVMDWVEGQTLRQRLDEGPLSLAATARLGARIAGALGHAHARGIVHRDVKPSNLIEAADGWRLLDFGIARRGHEEQRVTATGMLVGTVGYMSPEQARGERTPSPASDVFSLGCVLHECLSGACPFSAVDLLAVYAKVILCDPPPLDDIPDAFDALLARMLAKRAGDRLRDGDEVARALAGLGELSEAARERRPASLEGPTRSFVLVAPGEDVTERIATVAGEHGGDAIALVNGGVLVTTSGDEQATAIADALRRALPARAIAVGDDVDSAARTLVARRD